MPLAYPFRRFYSIPAPLKNSNSYSPEVIVKEVQYPTGDKSYLWRHLPYPQRMRRIARLACFLAARNLPNFPMEG